MSNSIENIFVFGSNLAGRHGKGAALEARINHGAKYGNPIGLQGRSYAIPTKDKNLITLPVNKIKKYVDEFIEFAESNKDRYIFNVTRIGCGLAGYRDEDIAPLFANVPKNVILPYEWVTLKNQLIVVNNKIGAFSIYNFPDLVSYLNNKKVKDINNFIDRSNEHLVEFVRRNPLLCEDYATKLTIIEIPKGIAWELIECIDGMEYIQEIPRRWYPSND